MSNLLSSPSSLRNPPPAPLPPLPHHHHHHRQQGLKRGPWTLQEDQILTNYINKEGEGKWRALPKKAGLSRCGKSCRLRWMNYLRPSVKRGHITADEEDLIIRLHRLLGNRWALIAGRIPGRTDNEIKNYWNTHITKKLISQGIDPRTHRTFLGSSSNTINNRINSSSISISTSTTNKFTANSSSLPLVEPINHAQNNVVGRQINTNTNDNDHDEEDEDHNQVDEEDDDVLSAFLNSLINGDDTNFINPANNSELNDLILNNNNNNNTPEYDQWDATAFMDSTFGLINSPKTSEDELLLFSDQVEQDCI